MNGLLLSLMLLPRPVLTGAELIVDAGNGAYKIHYTLSGADAPVHGATDADGNGIPDDVDAILAGNAKVYDHWVTQNKMQPPLPDDGDGGDGKIDIYLRHLDGPRGYTHPIPVGKAPAQSAYVEIDPFSALTDETQLAAAAGHETHHTIQYAYSTDFDPWIYEAFAAWVEHTDFTSPNLQMETNQHYAEIAAHPDIPLGTFNGQHEYDEMVFIEFLHRQSVNLATLWNWLLGNLDSITEISHAASSTPAQIIYSYGFYLANAPCHTGALCNAKNIPVPVMGIGAIPASAEIPLLPASLAFVSVPSLENDAGLCGGIEVTLTDGQDVVTGQTVVADTGYILSESPNPQVVEFARGLGGGDSVTVSLSAQPNPYCAPDKDLNQLTRGCGCELGKPGASSPLAVSLLVLIGACFFRRVRRIKRIDAA